MAMRSIYTGTKADGTLALAIDMSAIRDEKTLGKFLQLAAEASLVIDRVEPWQVEFMAPIIHRTEPAEDRSQMVIDFSKPAAGEIKGTGTRLGPLDMPVGFQCGHSGGCPNESWSCDTCQYGQNGFPKAEEVAAVNPTEKTPEEVAADMQSSAFAMWATMSPEEREASGMQAPEPLPENSILHEEGADLEEEHSFDEEEEETMQAQIDRDVENVDEDGRSWAELQQQELEEGGRSDMREESDEVAAFDQALADSQEAAA